MRRDLLLVVGWLGLVAAGCNRSPAPSPAPVTQPVAVVRPSVETEPPPVEPPPTEEAAEGAVADAKADGNDIASEPEPVDHGAAERIAILTPGGPVIIDARLSLDGQPHAASLEHLVQQVHEAADADGDGRATWKELAANEKFLADKLAANETSGTYQLSMWTEQHDLNRDGRIQVEEAASWLGRNAGRTARAFALRTSRAYSPDPRLSSRVWPLVDADGDGQLSAEELDGAAARLWSLDANDDRVIAPTELASLRDQLAGRTNPAPTTGGRLAARLAALHLEPKCDLERVDFVLQDMYSPLQDLGPTSFAALASLYDKLKSNDDDWLDRNELANLLSMEPHVELAVAFQQSPPEGELAATVEVRRRAPEISLVAQDHPDRVVLALGPTRLVVSAADLTPAPEAAAAMPSAGVERTQLRLMVHDQGDALFAELDADSSGQLSEREIATAPARLRARDDNGDGRLSGDELPYAMIVAFLRGEPLNRRGFFTPAPAAAPTGKAETPAWFAHADLNQDGDVSRREFLGASEQFAKIDANADGYLDETEAAGSGGATP